jgi:SnoaL-like domain
MIQPIQTPITGNEDQGDLSSPFQALVQFYHAFNAGDLDEMSRNWEQSEDIAMDNPLGGIMRGWSEIAEVYKRIFNSPADVYVEYYDYTIHEHGEVFYAVGRERGFFQLGETRVDLAIRTTRIFRKVGNTWRQTHHHGSIDNAELLANYQSAVLGK